MYRVNLVPYSYVEKRFVIKDGVRVLSDETVEVNMKDELFQFLRLPGVYKNGIETCDGVTLANEISDAGDSIDIREKDWNLLCKVLNVLIAVPQNPQTGIVGLGGDRYIEMIRRVFKAENID